MWHAIKLNCRVFKLLGFEPKNTHFIWWNVAVDGGEKTNVAQNQTKSKTFWSKNRSPTATLCHTAKRSFSKFWLGFILETQLGCDHMTSVYSFRTRLPHKPEPSKSQPSPASETLFCKAFECNNMQIRHHQSLVKTSLVQWCRTISLWMYQGLASCKKVGAAWTTAHPPLSQTYEWGKSSLCNSCGTTVNPKICRITKWDLNGIVDDAKHLTTMKFQICFKQNATEGVLLVLVLVLVR